MIDRSSKGAFFPSLCQLTYLFPPLSLYPWAWEELPPMMMTSCSCPDLVLCLYLGLSPVLWMRPPQLVSACSSGPPWLWVSGRACDPCSGPLLGSAGKWEKTRLGGKKSRQECLTRCIICWRDWSPRAINVKIHASIFAGIHQLQGGESVSTW